MSLFASALMFASVAAPLAAQDAWHRYSTPEGIGSFEVPCSADIVDKQAGPLGDAVMCEADGLIYTAAVLPVRLLAPDDLSAEELNAYDFEAFEAEAAGDPELADFLAVEAGGMPGFYVASTPSATVSRMLAHDLGNGEALLLLAMSNDVITDTPDGMALGKDADRFLLSFKVTLR